MSPTYISGALIVLAQLFAWSGIEVDIDALNTTVNTIITIAAAIVVAYRRWAKGDINALGSRTA